MLVFGNVLILRQNALHRNQFQSKKSYSRNNFFCFDSPGTRFVILYIESTRPVGRHDRRSSFTEVQLSVARITSTPVLAVNEEEKIRFRAYELFQQRGCQHGRDLDDWLQAEAELLHRKMEPTAVNVAKAAAAAGPTIVKRASSKRSAT
jgi:Protein of unknown function (DUF2934)